MYTDMDRYLPYELTSEDIVQPTTASDVYSMGCLGLAFIFLQPPYAHRANHIFIGIFQDVRNGVPPAVRPNLLTIEESELWLILEHCWALVPGVRPSARSVLEALHDDMTLPPMVHQNINSSSSLP